MKRSMWLGLVTVCLVQWAALDAANYLGRLKGRHEMLALVSAYDAGLEVAHYPVRLCLQNAPRQPMTAKTDKTGST